MKRIQVLALLCSVFAACGVGEQDAPSVSQAFVTSWTGTELIRVPIQSECGFPPREIQFMRTRRLFGTSYYEYIESNRAGNNRPDGGTGPFVSLGLGVLVQTLFCSQTSDASLGLKLTPYPFNRTWLLNGLAATCGLVTYWPDGHLSTAHVNIAPLGIFARLDSPVQAQGTTYAVGGARDPVQGWCQNESLSLFP